MTTTAIVPQNRGLEQRLAALATANQIRSRRAEFKIAQRELPSIESIRQLQRIIISPPAWLETMTILDALLTAHGVGRTRALRLLRCAHVSERRGLRALTIRQRMTIVAELDAIAKRRGAR